MHSRSDMQHKLAESCHGPQKFTAQICNGHLQIEMLPGNRATFCRQLRKHSLQHSITDDTYRLHCHTLIKSDAWLNDYRSKFYLAPAEWVTIRDVEVMVGSLGVGGGVYGSMHKQHIVHSTTENPIICFLGARVPETNKVSSPAYSGRAV